MILINLIAFVICTIVALGCAVGRDQMGFTVCAIAAAVNGLVAYAHYVGF